MKKIILSLLLLQSVTCGAASRDLKTLFQKIDFLITKHPTYADALGVVKMQLSRVADKNTPESVRQESLTQLTYRRNDITLNPVFDSEFVQLFRTTLDDLNYIQPKNTLNTDAAQIQALGAFLSRSPQSKFNETQKN